MVTNYNNRTFETDTGKCCWVQQAVKDNLKIKELEEKLKRAREQKLLAEAAKKERNKPRIDFSVNGELC